MFNDLQQQRSGLRTKERTRLFLSLAVLLVLGCLIWGVRFGGPATAPKPTDEPPGPAHAPEAALHELDPAPFASIRAGTTGPAAFDAPALDYALKEIAAGRLARAPKLVLEPKDVLALDPTSSAGTLIEVLGTVRGLDKEAYDSRDNPAHDRLWSFALEGADGARIAVVVGAMSTNPEGGRPRDRRTGGEAPAYLEDGNLVRARGIYLQRRTGAIGGLTFDAPTPVLVGREFRRAVRPPPAPETISGADWESLQDRNLESTQRVDDDVQYQLLLWMKSKGHDEILKELRSGAIPVQGWTRDTFTRWSYEFKHDTNLELPDPRTWTNAARGQVFTTTGLLADYLQEDWDTVGSNLYDVGSRSKYWIKSDYYANVLMMMDSAFPLSTFPTVPAPRKEVRPRVRVYGIFVRNFSYKLGAQVALYRPDLPGEITVPYFLLLHMEPDTPYRTAPLIENPFFWTWVSLALFGGIFFLVMSRMEKKEVAMITAIQKRVRKTSRGSVYVPKAERPLDPPPESEGGP